ncbi:hypothetical protein, partial [Dysosmobacter sp. HCP28S3_G4]|uniref:hypothetical protein n=1 Tax=Dysosmobacter sp. HCP28S3_G4 TaxID=3438938 RepID=UPI003F891C3D
LPGVGGQPPAERRLARAYCQHFRFWVSSDCTFLDISTLKVRIVVQINGADPGTRFFKLPANALSDLLRAAGHHSYFVFKHGCPP